MHRLRFLVVRRIGFREDRFAGNNLVPCDQLRRQRAEISRHSKAYIRVAPLLTVSTRSTDDVGGERPRLGTLVLSVTLFTTVLTQLILVVSQRSVQRGELSQLVSLVVVLAFRSRGGLQNREGDRISFSDRY